MQIIAARNHMDIDVMFLDDRRFVKEHTTYANFKKGTMKNPYDITVFGIGWHGYGKYKTILEGHKIPREYYVWQSILERCYWNKKKFPAYKDCEICDEWRDYQVFAEWYEENQYPISERLHIDKDILFTGNKIYSPQTCLLVPQRINMMFVNPTNSQGLPTGIRRSGTRYRASYCGKHIGAYNSVEEAYAHYAEAKEQAIKRVADEYKDIIPQKVYEALYRYKCDINADKNYVLSK